MDWGNVEGDAELIYSFAGFEAADPPGVSALCRALTGAAPRYAPLREEACLSRVGDDWRVFVRNGTSTERAAWLVGHELAHWWYDRHGYPTDDTEADCDALGAALAAPRPAFVALTKRWGHKVVRLASAFRVTQSLALLRIGETTGRPVALLTKRPLVRGEPFGWPEPHRMRRAIYEKPAGVHPVRLVDERLWGLMAA